MLARAQHYRKNVGQFLRLQTDLGNGLTFPRNVHILNWGRTESPRCFLNRLCVCQRNEERSAHGKQKSNPFGSHLITLAVSITQNLAPFSEGIYQGKW